MANERIELGDRAKDKVSGLEGIVMIESNYLYACRRLTIQPETVKDGKPAECQTFDEHQLKLMKKGAVKPFVPEPVVSKSDRPGGYNDGPKAQHNPKR